MVETLQQQRRLAQKDAGEDGVQLVLAVYLAEGDAPVDELLHVPGSVRQRGPGAQEEGGEPLQDPVVAVAVDDVHPSPPPSDVDVPGYDVVVPPYPQQAVQGLPVLLELGRQCFHRDTSRLIFSEFPLV